MIGQEAYRQELITLTTYGAAMGMPPLSLPLFDWIEGVFAWAAQAGEAEYAAQCALLHLATPQAYAVAQAAGDPVVTLEHMGQALTALVGDTPLGAGACRHAATATRQVRTAQRQARTAQRQARKRQRRP
jgi:hypothetical protein